MNFKKAEVRFYNVSFSKWGLWLSISKILTGVTKLILWHLQRRRMLLIFSNPLRYYKEYCTYFVSFCNLSIRSAISSASSSQPFFFWEMSQFWQKTHLRLHIPKNIVPEPFQPWRTDSSPKWGKADETMAFLPILGENYK